MSYNVFLNERNIIEIVSSGVISHQDAVGIGQAVLELANQLSDQGLPVNIVADSSQVVDWTQTAGPLLISIFSNIPYHRVATFGANQKVNDIQQAALDKTNLHDKIKFFQTREEAETWVSE